MLIVYVRFANARVQAGHALFFVWGYANKILHVRAGNPLLVVVACLARVLACSY